MALQLSKLLDNPQAKPFNSLVNLVDLSSTAGELYLVAPEDIKSEVYIFDTRGEEEATLESDITDNWVEDNTSMQDHIGLKPMTITLRGYVGELTNKLPKELTELQEKAYNSLGDWRRFVPNANIMAASPFAPTLTTQAQYIVNRANEVYGIYKKANRTISRLEDRMEQIPTPDVTNQQKVWGRFYELWEKRSLVSVYTPFGVFTSMAILSLNARQEEESSYISEFSVTFKKVRIAGEIKTYNDEDKQKQAQAALTLSEQKDKGIKKPSNKSLILQGIDQAKKLLNGSI